MQLICRLCFDAACVPYATLDREYLRCLRCDLVQVAESDLPSAEAELREYRLHDNNPDDLGYRRFLDQLVSPLIASNEMTQEASALDYGSGPTPLLAMMMQEQNIRCEYYDPFFAPKDVVLRQKYDLIACSEVIEHFHHPRRDFDLLASMLNPGGVLGVMTQLRPSSAEFVTWHYRRDITHVALYSRRTIEWLSEHYGWSMESPSPRVHIFKSPQPAAIS